MAAELAIYTGGGPVRGKPKAQFVSLYIAAVYSDFPLLNCAELGFGYTAPLTPVTLSSDWRSAMMDSWGELKL